jgi:hypothetical protein
MTCVIRYYISGTHGGQREGPWALLVSLQQRRTRPASGRTTAAVWSDGSIFARYSACAAPTPVPTPVPTNVGDTNPPTLAPTALPTWAPTLSPTFPGGASRVHSDAAEPWHDAGPVPWYRRYCAGHPLVVALASVRHPLHSVRRTHGVLYGQRIGQSCAPRDSGSDVSHRIVSVGQGLPDVSVWTCHTVSRRALHHAGHCFVHLGI